MSKEKKGKQIEPNLKDIILEKFKKIDQKKSTVENSIAGALDKLLVELHNVKRYRNKRKLMALSMCMTDKYMRKHLIFYLQELKYTQKFDKNVMEAIDKLAKAVSAEYHNKQYSKFLNKFGNNGGRLY